VIKVYQNDYSRTRGDCLRACVASILEDLHVPNFAGFAHNRGTKMMDELESWLDQHGYDLILHRQQPNIRELVIACGTVASAGYTGNHCVVERRGVQVHDPDARPKQQPVALQGKQWLQIKKR
jgi:hypothetical protein